MKLSALISASIVLVGFLVRAQAAPVAKSEAAAADKSYSLNCATGDMPTTTYNLRTEGDTVIVKMTNHNGTAFMPIHEGVIVPNDFKYLADKAKVLSQMPAIVEFRFPLSRCKIYGPHEISCGGGERKDFNGTDIEAMIFYTGKTYEETLGLKLPGYKATLSVHSSTFAPVMDMSMVYGEDECKMNF